jgi:hypothetical protein
MATLISSGPVPVTQKDDKHNPVSTYQQYSDSRKELPFDENQYQALNNGKIVFKESVIGQFSQFAPEIKIGEYFVFKISELHRLIESSPEADYIHFQNTVDEHHYHKLYAIPVQSKAIGQNKEVINPNSILLDSYPCPPDPRCPK